ncbi:MAG: Ig-like domain-containing protein [Butyrivibrio sp.]|nr:Ig-like domain-containing protein [Butyrivibrio sp.]
MKRSLKLFNKKGKKPRRRQDVPEYDEEFEDDYYEDEEFEEDYGDEDYAEDDDRTYEDDYADDRDEDGYPEERYAAEDHRESKSYSRKRHGDFDHELREDDDFDLDYRDDDDVYEDEESEDDRYEDDDCYQDDVDDDRYEDKEPELAEDESDNIVAFPGKSESAVDDSDDLGKEPAEESGINTRFEFTERVSEHTKEPSDDDFADMEIEYKTDSFGAEAPIAAASGKRASEEFEDEDYDPEFEEDYGDEEADNRYADDEDYRDEDDDRYEDDEDYRDEDDRYYEDDRYDEDDYEGEDYDEDEDDYAYAAAGARSSRGKRADRHSGRSSRRDKKHDRRRDREGAGAKILEFIKNTSFAERAAAVVAILLVVGGIVTMNFYSKALGRTAEINSFAEVGADMEFGDVIGSSGLLAVADAERARAMAAGMIAEEEEEEEEVADDAQGVTIKMTLTTIKSDMKIKFINSETNKLVANVPFVVSVVTPDGTKVTYDDHDKDGIIYKNNLTAGKYKVTPQALPAEFENYNVDLGTQSLTIKDTVETKVVDVSNEIKKESQVNAAKEDTAVQDVIESALTDTVEWVDSNQGSASGDNKYTYEEVSKDSVASVITGSAIPSGTVKRLSATRGRTEGEVAGETRGENSGDENQGGDGEQTTPAPLDVTKASVTLNEGETDTVGLTGSTEDLTCESSNSSIATVEKGDSSVTIKAVAEGDATITVTSKGGSKTISVKVNKVVAPLSDMTFSPSSLSVKAGVSSTVTVNGPSQFKATPSNDNISITTSGTTITVEGKKEGTAKVTVEAEGYNTNSFDVTVTKADPKTMTLSTKELSIKKNTEDKVTVSGVTGTISVSSTDSQIATATVSGTTITVKGIKEGEVTFKVSADGYETAEFKVKVTAADKKDMTVAPSEKTITLKAKDTKDYTVTGPDKIKAVTVESGKEKYVKAEKTGDKTFKITALEKGAANVTITADDYNDYTIAVTVGDGAELKLKATKITLVPGKTYRLLPENASIKPKYESTNTGVAKVAEDGTITAVAAGEATIKVNAESYKEATATVKVINDTTLKDKDGNVLWVRQADGSYREAKYSDYFNSDIKSFYLRKENKDGGVRHGWWTIDGKTYYYDKNGNAVTGEQVIKGAKYSFGSDGALSASSGTLGIDVSKWNGNIDWNKVKSSGVNFVIIRCGYRGSSAGALIEDPKFRANIKGAQAAGLRVGVYFFSQAVNEVEAVEEASMCINLCKGYSLSFPIYIDVEGSNGRGDTISASQRTANIKAFCGTIQNGGYRAGVYSNKTWFTKNINTASLTNYKIWLAQYAANVSYTATRYDMWQYTSKGSVSGISGNVDMNILYN